MGMFDIFGGNRSAGSSSGMSPIGLAVLGTLAYQALKHKGQLADMLGGKQREASVTASLNPSAAADSGGGLFGALGGGGGLASGLRDLFDRFSQSGHEDKVQSWVSTGANRSIEPTEMEQVLGPDRIQWLMQQTGLPKEQLLAGLSKELPSAIDRMTPNGQVPSDDEFAQQLRH